MNAHRIAMAGAALVSLVSAAAGAQAEGGAPGNASAPPASPAPAAAQVVRKDPAGQKGMSPFWELLIQGDSAYLARDFDAAISAYRAAITQDPKNPLGHYRMGQAQVAKGDLAEGQAAYDAGARFSEANPVLRAKLMFVLADLAERQRASDEALLRWKKYAEFVAANPAAHGFPGTADERLKRITEWVQLSQQSAQVRERNEKRLQQPDAPKSP
ncbi:MAG: tetratricopeptide repeat protein [Polyangiaceae bacterium]|nr:tetratricopeptide repeat protein [Polyangiaceae bacterium]